MARADRTGLSLGYRIGWRLRYAAVSVSDRRSSGPRTTRR